MFPARERNLAGNFSDFNWGVTFDPTNTNRFFATLGTQGHTCLVEGNLAARRANVLRDGVECPSVSPDGTRIAFKMKTADNGDAELPTWRPALLDLTTLKDHLLAETRSVDDQIEWLDQLDGHLLGRHRYRRAERLRHRRRRHRHSPPVHRRRRLPLGQPLAQATSHGPLPIAVPSSVLSFRGPSLRRWAGATSVGVWVRVESFPHLRTRVDSTKGTHPSTISPGASCPGSRRRVRDGLRRTGGRSHGRNRLLRANGAGC